MNLDQADSHILEAIRRGGAAVERAAEASGLKRVTVSRRLARLVEAGYVRREGRSTRPVYSLGQARWWCACWHRRELLPDSEGDIWATQVAPLLDVLEPNVRNIAHSRFTEMLNNAIDHSDADTISVNARLADGSLQMAVMDDGIGIFRRIAAHQGIKDHRLAVLDLSKGKLTTVEQG